MTNDKGIINFVRHTLGCTCPDEVFDQIECRDGGGRTSTYTQSITLGGRLLIYIWKTNDPSLVEAELPAMLAAGKNERDRRGLNRFRAVIATDDVDRIGSIAKQLFRDLSDKDEKVHLHVVNMHDVANLGKQDV
ncbi:MAG: hypothetical protein HWN68_00850 [Desulfobacterales bacterium]|nr:hypothetical protein [Desulfobacterales bacterium]